MRVRQNDLRQVFAIGEGVDPDLLHAVRDRDPVEVTAVLILCIQAGGERKVTDARHGDPVQCLRDHEILRRSCVPGDLRAPVPADDILEIPACEHLRFRILRHGRAECQQRRDEQPYGQSCLLHPVVFPSVYSLFRPSPVRKTRPETMLRAGRICVQFSRSAGSGSGCASRRSPWPRASAGLFPSPPADAPGSRSPA